MKVKANFSRGLLGVLFVFLVHGLVKAETPAPVQVKSNVSTPQSSANTVVIPEDKDSADGDKDLNIKDGPDLEQLAPIKTEKIKAPSVMDFDKVSASVAPLDTIIVQKNYMPKTGRWQLFGALCYSPNDVFYKTSGIRIQAAYHFSEILGLEISSMNLKSFKSREVQDLETKQNVSVQNLVSPKNYLGLDLYLSGIYGKGAIGDRKIFPFEIYQNLGVGKMDTDQGMGKLAGHFAIGELITISRSSAIRADLSFYLYQSQDVNGGNQLTSNIVITVGYSWFFPEASTR
jgi:outer membrane beta-barrel protein